MSCDNELNITMPHGPQGNTGMSAYEVWKQTVENGTIEWDKSQTDVVDFFIYLKGEKGDDGKDGAEGKSAYEIWVEEVEAGNITDPQTGEPWDKSKTTIQDFWEYLRGADGKNGSTPEINKNTNTWWINGENTGIPYAGKDGTNGINSTVSIVDGYWYINNINTGVPVLGQSAYELWVIEVLKGKLVNPHGDGTTMWPTNKISLEDFWHYLRGKDGEDAQSLIVDGTTIQLGVPNVVARYYMYSESGSATVQEYVDPADGTVIYTVYDHEGNLWPSAKVAITVNGTTTIYNSEANGNFSISKDKLSTNGPAHFIESRVYYTAQNGTDSIVSTPMTTFIPRMVLVKATLTSVELNNTNVIYTMNVERSTDGGTNWENVPDYLTTTTNIPYHIYEVDASNISNVDFTYHIGNSKDSENKTSEFDSYKGTCARPRKTTDYYESTTVSYRWDGNTHIYAGFVDGLYGLTVHTDNMGVIAPIQPSPRLTNLTAGSEGDATFESNKYFKLNTVKADIITTDIDVSLLYSGYTTETSTYQSGGSSLTCYVPVQSNTTTNGLRLTANSFQLTGGGTIGTSHSNYVNINNQWQSDNSKTGLLLPEVYNSRNFYFSASNYFFQVFSFTANRENKISSDDRKWTLTPTPSGTYPGYRGTTTAIDITVRSID